MMDALKSVLWPLRDPSQSYLDIVMSVEGQLSRAEARKLMELAKSTLPNTVIVEIGTYRGRSTISLAFGSLQGNRNLVYAVDPHVEFAGVFGGQFGPADRAHLYSNLVRAKVGEIVAVVSLPSTAAARGWSVRNVGLLWIDGDHHYESARADYESWYPLLVEKAVIAFHDHFAPGVRQLLGELSAEGKIIPLGELERLSWFKLRGA